jgi:hypothetical protein
MRVVWATFHGGPLGPPDVGEAGMRAAEAATPGRSAAVVPVLGRVEDVTEDEFVELAPSFARTAFRVERAESISTETIVTATSNATAPMHVVTRRVRRVGGEISRTVTSQFLAFGLVTNRVPSRHNSSRVGPSVMGCAFPARDMQGADRCYE